MLATREVEIKRPERSYRHLWCRECGCEMSANMRLIRGFYIDDSDTSDSTSRNFIKTSEVKKGFCPSCDIEMEGPING